MISELIASENVATLTSPYCTPAEMWICMGRRRTSHTLCKYFATQIFLSQIVTNIFSESNCQSCPLCKARSSTNKDKCSVDKSSVDTFYFSVYVHKAYDDLDVSVEASNLEKVTCLNDDCGGTVSSDLDTQDGE